MCSHRGRERVVRLGRGLVDHDRLDDRCGVVHGAGGDFVQLAVVLAGVRAVVLAAVDDPVVQLSRAVARRRHRQPGHELETGNTAQVDRAQQLSGLRDLDQLAVGSIADDQ